MRKKCLLGIVSVVSAAFIAACAASPGLSVALVPIVCFAAYFLSTIAGAWILALVAAVYVALSLAFGTFGIFSVCAAAIIVLLTLPRLLGGRLPKMWELALCAAAGVVAVCACFGVYATVCRCSVVDAVVEYYGKLGNDPVVMFFAEKNYDGLTEDILGYAPFSPSDELYSADALRVFAENVGRELDGNVLWYLSGYGTFSGGIAFACSAAAGQASGVDTRLPAMKDMRLGHGYLKAVVLPVLAFALFYLYEPMRPAVRAVVNAAVTLPATLCGITLLYHSLDRVRGKPKIAAMAVFWLVIALSAVFYEWGLLILGFIGLADCVINARRWLDWALS